MSSRDKHLFGSEFLLSEGSWSDIWAAPVGGLSLLATAPVGKVGRRSFDRQI